MDNDFFISYTRDDEPWAEWIAWQLESEDYKVVLQAWDFRPGGDFVGHMETAADTSDRTIAVLSPAYQQAAFTAPEWRVAFAEDPRGDEGKLLPVRVVDFEPSGFFRTRIYIDLVNLDANEAKQAIITGARKERRKPHREPGFPGKEASAPSVKPRFPSELPPIWNIPYRKNLNFTGRSQLILQLREQFTEQGGPAHTMILSGLGGIGKTQLAIEYAYRYQAHYDVVWWVRAEEPATLLDDFASLATRLRGSSP